MFITASSLKMFSKIVVSYDDIKGFNSAISRKTY